MKIAQVAESNNNIIAMVYWVTAVFVFCFFDYYYVVYQIGVFLVFQENPKILRGELLKVYTICKVEIFLECFSSIYCLPRNFPVCVFFFSHKLTIRIIFTPNYCSLISLNPPTFRVIFYIVTKACSMDFE